MNRRLLLSLTACAIALLVAGVGLMIGFMPLGSGALGAAAVLAVLAVLQWRGVLVQSLEKPEYTIDLRSTLPVVAAHDPVSGLIHRTFFRLTLTQRVASARRHLQPLSLVLLELDGFERARPEKRDDALRLLGSVLQDTLRECDSACRYGDNIVAGLLEDTPESGAAAAAERVRKALTLSPSGRKFTLSAGIACYPSHALDADDLLNRSVAALASARAAGKDRVEIAGAD